MRHIPVRLASQAGDASKSPTLNECCRYGARWRPVLKHRPWAWLPLALGGGVRAPTPALCLPCGGVNSRTSWSGCSCMPSGCAAHIPGMNDFELKHPRAAAGTFTNKQMNEPGIALTKPSLDAAQSLAVQRLHDLALAGGFGPDEVDESARRIAESMNFTDENIKTIADEVSQDTFGYTATARQQVSEVITELRADGRHEHAAAVAALLSSSTPAGAATAPAGSLRAALAEDPRVQAGEVFDEIRSADGTIFSRRREGVYPDYPSEMRFQASRPLTPEEVRQFAGLVGYSYAANVQRGGLPDPVQDSPYSFVLYANTVEARRTNLSAALHGFEEELSVIVQEGSRLRPTKDNTRLVEGFNDPDLSFEIYYDRVSS